MQKQLHNNLQKKLKMGYKVKTEWTPVVYEYRPSLDPPPFDPCMYEYIPKHVMHEYPPLYKQDSSINIWTVDYKFLTCLFFTIYNYLKNMQIV